MNALLVKLNKPVYFSILENILFSVINFALIYLSGKFLLPAEFVKFNNLQLLLMLGTTVASAVVFQPMMIFSRDQRSSFVHISIIAGLLAIVSVLMWIFKQPMLLPSIGLLILFVTTQYQRWQLILDKRWPDILANHILLIFALVPSFWLLKINTAAELISVYSICLFVLLTINSLRLIKIWNWKKQGSIAEYFGFGVAMIVSAILFWYVTGGYLLNAKGLSDSDVVMVRQYQNFLSIFTTLTLGIEFYIIGNLKPGEKLQLSKKQSLVLFLGVMVSFASMLFLFSLVYPEFREDILLFSIWLLLYYFVAANKMIISVLKVRNLNKWIMIAQLSHAIILFLGNYFLNWSLIVLTACWSVGIVLSFIIVYIVMVKTDSLKKEI